METLKKAIKKIAESSGVAKFGTFLKRRNTFGVECVAHII